MEMFKKVLPYNIQFFGEEEGGNEPEVAEPVDIEETVVEETTGENEPEVAEPDTQDSDTNAQYAAARRKAEEEMRLARQATDHEYAKRFGHMVNPRTGKAVASERDYFETLDSQNTVALNNLLQAKGVDPTLIEQAIANNPTVRQAQEYTQQIQKQEADRAIQEDLKGISKLNPEIKSVDDLAKDPSWGETMRLVSANRLSVLEAYKLANIETLTTKRAEAAKQAAINQAKSKEHLEPTGGVSISDGLMDIPEKEKAVWKEYYPDASERELREKYTKIIGGN